MQLIKDEKYLEEDYRVVDLYGLEAERQQLDECIEHSNDRSLVAFLGNYGAGKSTLLHQVEKKHSDNQIWLHFDAWKYPERNLLWEGFVLDIAEQVDRKTPILNRIDGKTGKGTTIAKGGIGALFDAVDKASHLPIPVFKPIAQAIISAYAPSPVKRVFEIQDILGELINMQPKPIRIVIEDIDRSNDKGVYFLETLSYFLKNNDLKQEVKVIVPMEPDHYTKERPSYVKCIDYVTRFSPVIRKSAGIMRDVINPAIFDPNCLPLSNTSGVLLNGSGLQNQLSSFFDAVLASGITPREFKSLLREWVANYKRHSSQQEHVDYRVELLVQSAKFLNNSYDNMLKRNAITQNDLFGAYAFAIYAGRAELKSAVSDSYEGSRVPIKFYDEVDGGTMKKWHDKDHNPIIGVPRWYLF